METAALSLFSLSPLSLFSLTWCHTPSTRRTSPTSNACTPYTNAADSKTDRAVLPKMKAVATNALDAVSKTRAGSKPHTAQ